LLPFSIIPGSNPPTYTVTHSLNGLWNSVANQLRSFSPSWIDSAITEGGNSDDLNTIKLGDSILSEYKLSRDGNGDDPTLEWHRWGAQYGFIFDGGTTNYLNCFTKGQVTQNSYTFPLHCIGPVNGNKVGNDEGSFDNGVRKDSNVGEPLLLEPLPFLNVRLK
jgi:hypothetical protein